MYELDLFHRLIKKYKLKFLPGLNKITALRQANSVLSTLISRNLFIKSCIQAYILPTPIACDVDLKN